MSSQALTSFRTLDTGLLIIDSHRIGMAVTANTVSMPHAAMTPGYEFGLDRNVKRALGSNVLRCGSAM